MKMKPKVLYPKNPAPEVTPLEMPQSTADVELEEAMGPKEHDADPDDVIVVNVADVLGRYPCRYTGVAIPEGDEIDRLRRLEVAIALRHAGLLAQKMKVDMRKGYVDGRWLPKGYVQIPDDAREAEMMQKMGYGWLKQNAPDRLRENDEAGFARAVASYLAFSSDGHIGALRAAIKAFYTDPADQRGD